MLTTCAGIRQGEHHPLRWHGLARVRVQSPIHLRRLPWTERGGQSHGEPDEDGLQVHQLIRSHDARLHERPHVAERSTVSLELNYYDAKL